MKVCKKKKKKKRNIWRPTNEHVSVIVERVSHFSFTYQEYCAHHHSRHCDLNLATWRTFSSGSSWMVTCCGFVPYALKPRSCCLSELYDVRNTH